MGFSNEALITHDFLLNKSMLKSDLGRFYLTILFEFLTKCLTFFILVSQIYKKITVNYYNCWFCGFISYILISFLNKLFL